ncbi:MAG: TonB-dependent receptor [Chlorobiaceae bacterium]|nr:TonB-dependent receptor [Chlorobiaceae bacterium]
MKKTILTVLLLASVRPAMAAEQSAVIGDDSATVFTAGEVVVSGKKEIARERVSAREIEKLDRKTVTQAVNLLPGVTLGNVGGRNEGMIYVRGFDMRQVPLYLDGVPLYVPYDGYVDPNRFTTFDLSEIFVSKGFSSVLYGPNNLGGAINMVSRKPEGKLDGNVKGGISFADDALASKFTSINIGSNQGKWYVQAGGTILDRKFIALSDSFKQTADENGGQRDHSDTKDMKGSIRIGFTPNETDEYSLSFSALHSTKGIPQYTGADRTRLNSVLSAGSASDRNKVKYWGIEAWDKSSLYYIGKTLIGEKSYVKTKAYFDNYYNAFKYYKDVTYTSYSDISYYDEKTFGGGVEFGTEIISNDILKFALLDKSDKHRENSVKVPLPKEMEDNTFSAAVENTWSASKNISVIAGIRQDFHSVIRADGYNSSSTATIPFPTRDSQATNYQLAISGKLDDLQDITAYVAQNTRFPTLKDRYSYKNFTATPNPELQPEHSWNYGLDYSIRPSGNLRLFASVYQSRLTDTIQQVSKAVNGLDQMQNTGKSTFTGAEVAADWTAMKGLKTNLSYSYIKRENESNPAILFTDVPRNKLSGYLQFLLGKKNWVMLEGEYDSKRNSSSDGKYIAGSFAVANIRASAGLTGQISIQASVENLFDRNYQISEGYPEAGRAYVMSVAYAF